MYIMCFRATGYNKFIHFEVLSVNTTTPTGRGMYGMIAPRNFAEFHKLRRGIWHNLPRKKTETLVVCDVADLVRQLLDKGADVHCVTSTLDTPLHGSVAGNKPDITDMLIKAGEYSNGVRS